MDMNDKILALTKLRLSWTLIAEFLPGDFLDAVREEIQKQDELIYDFADAFINEDPKKWDARFVALFNKTREAVKRAQRRPQTLGEFCNQVSYCPYCHNLTCEYFWEKLKENDDGLIVRCVKCARGDK